MQMTPHEMTSVGKKNLGPIFLTSRLPPSSVAIYGLDYCFNFRIKDILGDNIPEKDGDADLILFIS